MKDNNDGGKGHYEVNSHLIINERQPDIQTLGAVVLNRKILFSRPITTRKPHSGELQVIVYR